MYEELFLFSECIRASLIKIIFPSIVYNCRFVSIAPGVPIRRDTSVLIREPRTRERISRRQIFQKSEKDPSGRFIFTRRVTRVLGKVRKTFPRKSRRRETKKRRKSINMFDEFF